MNEKELGLLAKEVYPEKFEERLKEMQEQINELKEPISQDKVTGDAPDRWSMLTDRLETYEKLLRRCYSFLEHAPEFPLRLVREYDIEELQHELAEALGDE